MLPASGASGFRSAVDNFEIQRWSRTGIEIAESGESAFGLGAKTPR